MSINYCNMLLARFVGLHRGWTEHSWRVVKVMVTDWGRFCLPSCIGLKYGSGNLLAPSSYFLSYRSLALTFKYYDHWLLMAARVLQPAFVCLCWLAGMFCQPVQCACANKNYVTCCVNMNRPIHVTLVTMSHSNISRAAEQNTTLLLSGRMK